MIRDHFLNFSWALYQQGLFLTIYIHNVLSLRLNHWFVVSRNSKLWYLHSYSIPASNDFRDELKHFLDFSLYRKLNFLSNSISRTKVFYRNTSFQFLFGSYLWSSFWPISHLHTFFTEFDKVGLITSKLFMLFFHHPIFHNQLVDQGFLICFLYQFQFRRSLYSLRNSESSSTFRISFFLFLNLLLQSHWWDYFKIVDSINRERRRNCIVIFHSLAKLWHDRV